MKLMKRLKRLDMRYLLSAKWAAIMLLNLTGSLKIIPLFVLILCFFIQLRIFKLGRSGFVIALGLLIIIAYKLIYGFDFIVNAGVTTTAFEGISIAFLLFVLPFFHSELKLINKNRWPIVSDVLNVTYIILLLDLVVRIYVHGLGQFFSLGDYTIAKEYGLFSTSNISGGLAFVLFCYSLNINGLYSSRLLMIIILLLGSLSRVSIFAAVLVMAHHIYSKNASRFARILVRTLVALFAMALLMPVYNYFISDGSFNSKIDLITVGVANFYRLTDLEILLFGFPLDSLLIAEFLDVEGWSPHVSFLKALLYYGIFGLVIWVIAHYYIWQKSQLRSVVAGGFVMGLAGLPILWPPLLLTLFAHKQLHKSPN